MCGVEGKGFIHWSFGTVCTRYMIGHGCVNLVVGAIFAFAISMGEFGATVFVARPQTPTLPLAIYRYLTYPGAMNYGQAMAMCCILMITTAIGFVLLEKIRLSPGDY